MFPHHVALPTPVRGFGFTRMHELIDAADRIAPDRHGKWTATMPDRSVLGFLDAETADAFRQWLAASRIDWISEPD